MQLNKICVVVGDRKSTKPKKKNGEKGKERVTIHADTAIRKKIQKKGTQLHKIHHKKLSSRFC